MLENCFKASYYYNTYVLLSNLFHFYNVILVKSNIRKHVLSSIVKRSIKNNNNNSQKNP